MKPSDYKQWEPTLKPLTCPFCGNMPKVLPSNPEADGDAWGAVQCTNKKCHAQPRVVDGSDCADMRGPGAYKDAAIRRWNKRHSVQGQPTALTTISKEPGC